MRRISFAFCLAALFAWLLVGPVLAASAMDIGVNPKFHDADRDWSNLTALPKGAWLRYAVAWWEVCLEPEREPDLAKFWPNFDRAAKEGYRVQVLLWPTLHPTFPQWHAFQKKVLGANFREPWPFWWRPPAYLWQRHYELDLSIRRQISERWASLGRSRADLEFEYFNEPTEVSRAVVWNPSGGAMFPIGYPNGYLDEPIRNYMNWFLRGPHAEKGFESFGHRVVGPSLCKAGVIGEQEEMNTFFRPGNRFYEASYCWSVNWNFNMNSGKGWEWFWKRAGERGWKLQELANGQKVPPLEAYREWAREELARRIGLFDALSAPHAKPGAKFVVNELYVVPTQAMDLSEKPDRERQAGMLKILLDELSRSGRIERVMVYSTQRPPKNPTPGIWFDYYLEGTPAWQALVDAAKANARP